MKRKPIKVVLFDMGGVLVTDIYDRILFSRRNGLAPKGLIARHRWHSIASRIWDRASVDPDLTEAQFWQAFGNEMTLPFDMKHIHLLTTEALRVNGEASHLLQALHQSGIRIGIISDNTSFWFPMQAALLNCEEYIEKDLVFLSCMQKVGKLTGLYNIAASHVDPRETLIVDDRILLRSAARKAGFRTVPYKLESRRSLEAALRRHGIILDNLHTEAIRT